MKPVVTSLRSILGRKAAAADRENRLLYSRDMMTGTTLDLKAGRKPLLPDLVVWPETFPQVSRILKIASRKKVPVIPFGGGSGVSGGTLPVKGGIILDLKRMDRIETIEFTPRGFVATVQTGILGERLEDQLNSRGFTLGHFPSSIFCATLGGYLATRSAGQLSSKYGKIEDMAEDVEVILADGTIIPFGGSVKKFPGIRPKDLFIGTEGCLGVITRARLRVHPLPPTTRYRGVSFNRLEDGLTAIRKIMQAGLRPSVIRLYDPFDSLLLQHGFEGTPGPFASLAKKIAGRLPVAGIKRTLFQFLVRHPLALQQMSGLLPADSLLILAFEGDPELAEAQEKSALEICRGMISRDLGEKPGLHWLEHRYDVSFKMPRIFEQGGFVDTIEVAATWDKLDDLYHRTRDVLVKWAIVLAHFSHAYPEGCSIYFTVVGGTGASGRDRKLYDQIWHEAMESCLQVGGTISHHHGIGLLKAKYLPRELGGMMDFYREIKRRIDPLNIMNPGKMGL